MRELKFRIWNEKHKKFFFWGFVGNDSIFSGIPTGSGITLDYAKENSEQFTGLHDKNGKEIHEGDGVRFYPYSEKINGVIKIVKWDDDGFWYPFQDLEYIDGETGDWVDEDKGFEIIGNIHENPELVK